MPRAEVGSTKYIANKMKSKGLQRLRWYCQACERQMRDENGFKCHVASESHVRNMVLIGEDPRKAINEFSNQFKRDFLQLLRTGHGEKKVNLNHFYQEYIANKEHIHMNATKWASLTEFAKYLGREGICRVEEDEKNDGRGGATGLMIAWIDDSPEALRRKEAIRKKEQQDRGNEEWEQRMIQEQIERAKRNNNGSAVEEDDIQDEPEEDDHNNNNVEGIKRNKEGEKIVLNFGAKKSSPEVEKPPTPPSSDKDESLVETATEKSTKESLPRDGIPKDADLKAPAKPISFSTSKPKNVFASGPKKPNAFNTAKKVAIPTAQKPMSEAERIMKEEIERKRQREMNGGNAFKKQRIS